MSTKRRPYTAERHRVSQSVSAEAPSIGEHDGTDAGAILRAIAGLADRIGGVEARLNDMVPVPAPEPEEIPEDLRRQVDEARYLRTEIVALARSIEDTKVEIAKLRDQRPEGDRLTDMAHELDAIVDATESATNGILDITESVSAMVTEIQAQGDDAYVRHLADDIQDKLMGVFEHCNFQDLTGQRINKVVNAMKFIEERLDRMMDIWGRDGFLTTAMNEADETEKTTEQRDQDLLNGPQTKEKSISQDEIDALFD